MIVRWSMLAFRRGGRRPDVIVVGTDPVFAAVTAVPLRLLAPDIRLAHWCFDMHPEAAVAEGIAGPRSLSVRLMRAIMGKAYRSLDLIADLGVCMRERLRVSGHSATECELTPWALVEPNQPVFSDPDTRYELFGDAKIGILYSGNFGEAHDFADFLALARALRDNEDVHFCFAVRGNKAEALRDAVSSEHANISFAGFAPIEELEKRLGSADIHLVSLKKEWGGIAVPSKFFGSIASGRPILYSGARDSDIGHWITKYQVGWVINSDNISEAARILARLAMNSSELTELQRHCHAVYQAHFSRRSVMEKWDRELRKLVTE
jgi:glycosyltransferase involved in cell wall biosynthesis